MTKQTRRKFSPEFKAKVALEAAKEQLTLAQLSQQFTVIANFLYCLISNSI